MKGNLVSLSQQFQVLSSASPKKQRSTGLEGGLMHQQLENRVQQKLFLRPPLHDLKTKMSAFLTRCVKSVPSSRIFPFKEKVLNIFLQGKK